MPFLALILAVTTTALTELIFVPMPRAIELREGVCEARAKSRQQEDWGTQAPDAFILETLRAALGSVG